MSDFDVEKEADKICGDLVCCRTSANMMPILVDFAARCRDATEEADIKLMCGLCCLCDNPPLRVLAGHWEHEIPQAPTRYCNASRLHERRRQREEPT